MSLSASVEFGFSPESNDVVYQPTEMVSGVVDCCVDIGVEPVLVEEFQFLCDDCLVQPYNLLIADTGSLMGQWAGQQGLEIQGLLNEAKTALGNAQGQLASLRGDIGSMLQQATPQPQYAPGAKETATTILQTLLELLKALANKKPSKGAADGGKDTTSGAASNSASESASNVSSQSSTAPRSYEKEPTSAQNILDNIRNAINREDFDALNDYLHDAYDYYHSLDNTTNARAFERQVRSLLNGYDDITIRKFDLETGDIDLLYKGKDSDTDGSGKVITFSVDGDDTVKKVIRFEDDGSSKAPPPTPTPAPTRKPAPTPTPTPKPTKKPTTSGPSGAGPAGSGPSGAPPSGPSPAPTPPFTKPPLVEKADLNDINALQRAIDAKLGSGIVKVESLDPTKKQAELVYPGYPTQFVVYFTGVEKSRLNDHLVERAKDLQTLAEAGTDGEVLGSLEKNIEALLTKNHFTDIASRIEIKKDASGTVTTRKIILHKVGLADAADRKEINFDVTPAVTRKEIEDKVLVEAKALNAPAAAPASGATLVSRSDLPDSLAKKRALNTVLTTAFTAATPSTSPQIKTIHPVARQVVLTYPGYPVEFVVDFRGVEKTKLEDHLKAQAKKLKDTADKKLTKKTLESLIPGMEQSLAEVGHVDVSIVSITESTVFLGSLNVVMRKDSTGERRTVNVKGKKGTQLQPIILKAVKEKLNGVPPSPPAAPAAKTDETELKRVKSDLETRLTSVASGNIEFVGDITKTTATLRYKGYPSLYVVDFENIEKGKGKEADHLEAEAKELKKIAEKNIDGTLLPILKKSIDDYITTTDHKDVVVDASDNGPPPTMILRKVGTTTVQIVNLQEKKRHQIIEAVDAALEDMSQYARLDGKSLEGKTIEISNKHVEVKKKGTEWVIAVDGQEHSLKLPPIVSTLLGGFLGETITDPIDLGLLIEDIRYNEGKFVLDFQFDFAKPPLLFAVKAADKFLKDVGDPPPETTDPAFKKKVDARMWMSAKLLSEIGKDPSKFSALLTKLNDLQIEFDTAMVEEAIRDTQNIGKSDDGIPLTIKTGRNGGFLGSALETLGNTHIRGLQHVLVDLSNRMDVLIRSYAPPLKEDTRWAEVDNSSGTSKENSFKSVKSLKSLMFLSAGLEDGALLNKALGDNKTIKATWPEDWLGILPDIGKKLAPLLSK